ncbi:MAG: TrmB family transcriptional regulator [Spirochaetes bacterium]|nr:TrmB family transcriptional regulator [Spirochaetota bacterium]
MIENINEIIHYLKEFGFTEYESKVYLSLLTQHPATAYTISQKSGVPHARVYDITRRLIEKGVALLASENPTKFSPLSPRDLIDKLKKEHTEYIDKLNDKLKNISFTSDFDPVWNISSRDEALQATEDIIQKATEKIYIGLWDDELVHLKPHLKKAFDQGIKIFVLNYGNTQLEFGEIHYHYTVLFEYFTKFGNTLDCVVDSRICLTGSLGNANTPAQIVWTQNRGLVKSIEEYIIHDFFIGDIQKEFGKEIENKFGKNLIYLREKYCL